jgi:adenosylhomocysteine nucleosidase
MIAVLTGLQAEADTIEHRNGLCVLCGTASRDDLEAVVPPSTDAIISWGVCGALSPALTIGALCISGSLITQQGATGLHEPTRAWATRLAALLGAPGLFLVRQVPTFSSPIELAYDPPSRAALFKSTGAMTVDEGSYAVANWAEKHGKPWAVVGAISDSWDQTVSSFTDLVDAQGNVRVPQAILGILDDPSSIPEVVEEAWTSSAALRNLTLAARILASAKWGL